MPRRGDGAAAILKPCFLWRRLRLASRAWPLAAPAIFSAAEIRNLGLLAAPAISSVSFGGRNLGLPGSLRARIRSIGARCGVCPRLCGLWKRKGRLLHWFANVDSRHVDTWTRAGDICSMFTMVSLALGLLCILAAVKGNSDDGDVCPVSATCCHMLKVPNPNYFTKGTCQQWTEVEGRDCGYSPPDGGRGTCADAGFTHACDTSYSGGRFQDWFNDADCGVCKRTGGTVNVTVGKPCHKETRPVIPPTPASGMPGSPTTVPPTETKSPTPTTGTNSSDNKGLKHYLKEYPRRAVIAGIVACSAAIALVVFVRWRVHERRKRHSTQENDKNDQLIPASYP